VVSDLCDHTFVQDQAIEDFAGVPVGCYNDFKISRPSDILCRYRTACGSKRVKGATSVTN